MEGPGVRIRVGAPRSSDDAARARQVAADRTTRTDRARVLGTMMAITVVIGVLAVADPSTVRPGWGVVFAGSLVTAGLVAAALLLVRRPWTDAALGVVVTMSMVVVTLSVLANQDRHAALLNVVLLLPANVFAAVHLARPAVRLTTGVMAACLAVLAMTLTGDPLQWVVLIGLPTVAFVGTTEVVLRMRHDLRQAMDSVRRQSLTDPLTGLLNRRALEERFQEPTAAAAVGAVLVLDIDHFKVVNDTHGHATGDEVLRRLARGLVEETRSEDVVVRLGGEEFLVLTTVSGHAADRFAETLRRRAAEWMAEWSATVSIGVAHLDATTVELTAPGLAEAIEVADGCLYRAKREGRDRVVSTIAPSPAPSS